MKREILDFVAFCKNHIITNIEDREGETIDASELGWSLTDRMNADGTFTYSTEMAKDYLREWFWDAGKYFDYEKVSFGENLHNPFENPEAFVVCMVIEGVNGILARCEYIDSHWNEEITLDSGVIGTIIEQVEEISDDAELF